MFKRNDIQKILIIGSGPIIIGQACEFEYSGTKARKALRRSWPVGMTVYPAVDRTVTTKPVKEVRSWQICASRLPGDSC